MFTFLFWCRQNELHKTMKQEKSQVFEYFKNKPKALKVGIYFSTDLLSSRVKKHFLQNRNQFDEGMSQLDNLSLKGV
ncbi:hypothetical protein VCHA37P191_150085 [Vibrio chagasii]|nr:hypothetical protein VCHA28FP16_100150 [Vibrio chagasii]CAH6993584.1 hypothetical protein VCHA37P191_150085 [Vibrio chagasii]CAH7064347.1 hypothetical protein VCHA36O157_80058 [Vibrio chagasii]CAH7073469.1 hypothetical protein VCHA51O444_160058 [Vibrio chagasii]CAH7083243.1 hypothetical protein VCHA34P115_80151 [Vibrio chagasii]